MNNAELYIARDKDGTLFVSEDKPYKSHFQDCDDIWSVEGWYILIDSEKYPSVTWENSPQQVELKLKLENGNKD